MAYCVMVYDDAHEHRHCIGEFATLVEARDFCKSKADDGLPVDTLMGIHETIEMWKVGKQVTKVV